MKNKEKKFGQLGSEEDPVITITKEQVRDYFGTLEHIQTSPWDCRGIGQLTHLHKIAESWGQARISLRKHNKNKRRNSKTLFPKRG